MAKMAAMKAYNEAGNHGYLYKLAVTMVTGIKATDAQVIEVHDCFSTNELLTYEALVSYWHTRYYSIDVIHHY